MTRHVLTAAAAALCVLSCASFTQFRSVGQSDISSEADELAGHLGVPLPPDPYGRTFNLSQVHVVYATTVGPDDNFKGFLASAASVAQNMDKAAQCTIHVIVPEEDLERARGLLDCLRGWIDRSDKGRPDFELHAFKPPSFVVADAGGVERLQGKHPTLARLALDEYLPDVQRAIYLDTDTIVQDDVANLYEGKVAMPAVMRATIAAKMNPHGEFGIFFNWMKKNLPKKDPKQAPQNRMTQVKLLEDPAELQRRVERTKGLDWNAEKAAFAGKTCVVLKHEKKGNIYKLGLGKETAWFPYDAVAERLQDTHPLQGEPPRKLDRVTVTIQETYPRLLNAGVLLIDVERWRWENVTASIAALANRTARDGVPTDDQFLLNMEFRSRRLAKLSPRWNVNNLGALPNCRPFNRNEAAVLHWSGEHKPWKSGEHFNVDESARGGGRTCADTFHEYADGVLAACGALPGAAAAAAAGGPGP